MLSTASRPYIAASVPVLREHGVTITRCFYQRLFVAHPELKNIFNMPNQESGTQQQALASAIFAYAANIDNPDALAPVISRIVQKHVSLGIKAEHYPIVGKHLLDAIAEILGAAATPELLAAWAEAYGLLADALIAEERKLYQAHGVEPGEYRSMTVIRKQKESETVTSFYLQASDGSELPSFQPGQYISVAVNVAELSLRQLRQYSLSDAPGTGYWRISVKREEGSPAGLVSNLLHDQYQEGDVLWVSPPCGDFVLSPESTVTPLVMISAGVGVTPMMSMLHSSLEHSPERPVNFLYATLDGQHHPLKHELNKLLLQHAQMQSYVAYERPAANDCVPQDYQQQGYLRLAAVPDALLPQNAVYFLCGPAPFMQAQRKALLERGVAEQQIQQEVFGPSLLEHLQ
ncbi:Flavohemoprotein (Hemoglobin-like protein) [Collimonas arenae]|uniref:Flavohemoprotein n=1 Tax=Collimonas arenae TaxID=279058 RepID=A0A0A1FA27_9BURK|nr:NO-inducible flavohemoprotein [Collimonas arenae]AIY41366.1 Flavohemoprotein (Hemoglobin-like protein) [Collimonas arenae]